MVNKNDLDENRIASVPIRYAYAHFFFTSSVSVGSSNDLTR